MQHCFNLLNTKDLTSFRNANRKIRIPKAIRSSEMLNVLHKVKGPTRNKN